MLSGMLAWQRACLPPLAHTAAPLPVGCRVGTGELSGAGHQRSVTEERDEVSSSEKRARQGHLRKHLPAVLLPAGPVGPSTVCRGSCSQAGATLGTARTVQDWPGCRVSGRWHRSSNPRKSAR